MKGVSLKNYEKYMACTDDERNKKERMNTVDLFRNMHLADNPIGQSDMNEKDKWKRTRTFGAKTMQKRHAQHARQTRRKEKETG